MKKKPLLLSLLMLSSVFALGSCSKNENDSSLNSLPGTSIESIPDIEIHWNDNKTYLDESKLNGELLTTTTVRVHYYRDSLDYDNWNLWIWQTNPEEGPGKSYNFGMYDRDGIIADIPLSSLSDDKVKQIGLIVRKSTKNNEWAEKDIEKNRYINIPEKTSDGIYDIYLEKNREMIYESKEEAKKDAILAARASFINRGGVNYTAIIELSIDKKLIDPSKVSIYENNQPLDNYTVKVLESSPTIQLIFDKDFRYDFEKEYSVKYQFDENNTGTKKLLLYGLYDSKEFNDRYNYDGDDLGVTFSRDKLTTTFKLWAPLSKSVTLNLYERGTKEDSNKIIRKIPLTKGEKGVFETTVNEYLHGKYYTYSVNNSGTIEEVVDPYAKSCGVNGLIGMIVDFDKVNEELEWDKVNRPTSALLKNNVDTSIYEIHVRDMTIDETSGVSKEHRGKFLGLTEEGTKYTKDGKSVSTGLDHLKELGISHVQIQPFYDYNSVDETKDDGYNWGYDPLNYNCLEGSYATDPSDGLVRVKEFKTMMKSLLNNGIQVNMDVVYNHTAENSNTNFEKIVPGYYHRLDDDFNFTNGSGCGNEMASEHYMYRKFVVDSCKFFVQEYKLSGFRFDLMGLVDLDTMEQVYKECAKVYDKVMIYGEPWTGGATNLPSMNQTNQGTLNRIDGIVGAFNDKIRNAIRGDNSPDTGWAQGDTRGYINMKKGLEGKFSSPIDPNRVINYVSCHDNYTLFDQLNLTLKGDRLKNIEDVYKQCEALVFTSQGVPFLQEGEDFLRTKASGEGSEIHNSYKAGDHVNKMDYSLKLQNVDMFNYFKDLIQLRKDQNLLRLGDKALIKEQMKFIGQDDKIAAYQIKDPNTNKELLVVHSLDEVENYDLGGTYKLLFDNTGKYETATSYTKINLKSNTSYVFEK